MPKLRRLKGNIEACHLRYYPGRAGTRRNPGRMDKLAYNGSWFICPADVDGRHDDPENDTSQEVVEFEDIWANEGSRASQPIVISLIEIARPAKAKGLAKDFEVIDTPRRVIALEDDENVRECASDEDWEEVYLEDLHDERRMYSTVLRGSTGR